MVMIYAKLVLAGRRTLDQVPEAFRGEVSEIIEEMKNK